MTPDDIKFYRDLYRVMADPAINALIVKYAEKQYNKGLQSVRVKHDSLYDYGHANGVADAWEHVIKLKDTLTKIMQNV